MKHSHVIRLVLLITLLNACNVLKHNKIDTYNQWSVATIVHPKAKNHPETTSKKEAGHFSGITFPADSAGLMITVKDDYDAGKNTFFYFHARTGDQFSVRYDTLNPHHYIIYSNKPWIDQAVADTTIGKISKVDGYEGYVEYAYLPHRKDSLDKSETVIHRMQDTRSDSLKNEFPDLKKGSEYPVLYSKTDPSKSYLMISPGIGQIPFQSSGTHQLHGHNGKTSSLPKLWMTRPIVVKPHGHNVKMSSHHKAYNEKGANSFSSFMTINIAPIESLRVGYSLLCFERLAAGIDASLVYKNQKAQKGQTNGKSELNILNYPQPYFSLNKNLYILNPYIKYYVYRQQGHPGSGVYLRAGYSLTSLMDGLRSDYYNKPGISLDTSAAGFISMDPAHNKVLTTTSSFKTTGFTLSVGGSFYLGQSGHWMVDLGLGYNYLKLPAVVTSNRVVNNETYYYHISPMWRNPVDFPFFIQTSFMYKF